MAATRPCCHRLRTLTAVAPEYATPGETGAFASTLTTARGSDAAGGAPAYASTLTTASTDGGRGPEYASTLTAATGAGEQRRGVASLGADGYSSSA